jgi:hypothetical protein
LLARLAHNTYTDDGYKPGLYNQIDFKAPLLVHHSWRTRLIIWDIPPPVRSV